MLKRSITYTNPFTEQEVTEEHYFHISKADLVEMEMEEHNAKYRAKDGSELTGMQAKLQRIIDSEDGKAIMAEFKDIIRRSYGVKQGERFLKTKEAWEDFSGSEAFSQLLFEICTKPDSAAEFITGVVPHNLEQIAADVRKQAADAARGGSTTTPAQREEQIADNHAILRERGIEPKDPTGLTTPTPETPREPGTASWGANSGREREVAAATSENPVVLTRSDIIEMDADDLKAGVAEGRYKLS